MSAESLTQAIRRLAAHESLDANQVRRAFGVMRSLAPIRTSTHGAPTLA